MLKYVFYYVKDPVCWDCNWSKDFSFSYTGATFAVIYEILFLIFAYLLKGEHRILPPQAVPYRELFWYGFGRHWLMCEGLPAILSTSLPILYTQRTDSNLWGCHVDALRPLYTSQARKPLRHAQQRRLQRGTTVGNY